MEDVIAKLTEALKRNPEDWEMTSPLIQEYTSGGKFLLDLADPKTRELINEELFKVPEGASLYGTTTEMDDFARQAVESWEEFVGVERHRDDDFDLEEAKRRIQDKREKGLPRGWGLTLIEELMDELEIDSTDKGTLITMTKYR